MSQRARDKLASRKTKVASYYFDADLVGANWGVDGKPRWYHHTAVRGISTASLCLRVRPADELRALRRR